MDAANIAVAVAAIVTLPATAVAAVSTWRKVGSPNGHGTVVGILEHVLRNQEEHSAEIAVLHERLDRLEGQK